MPAYNSEKYVSDAMESMLAQTFKTWELIAVDDGSTDQTGRIMNEFAARDPRIRVVHTENKGVSHARNTGLDMATGEWVAFLDSDDMYEADALEVMLGEADDANLVIGNFKLNPEKGKRRKIVQTKIYRDLKEIKPDLNEYLNTWVLYVVWGKLIRRDMILTRFCEGCHLGEDMLFMNSLLGSIEQIEFIPQSVYTYRRDNENSLSHQIDDDFVQTVRSTVEYYINYFNDVHITKLMYARYLNKVIVIINELFHNSGYQEDYLRKHISSLLQSDFLRQIPLAQYPLTPRRQRIAMLLLIGDIDLIMDAFNEEYRRQRKNETQS